MNFGRGRASRTASPSWTPPSRRGSTSSDTANGYAAATEQIVGRWLAQGGGRREKVVLATKVRNVAGDWLNDSEALGALHPRRARPAPPAQTDYIDLYQMHYVDRATPWRIW